MNALLATVNDMSNVQAVAVGAASAIYVLLWILGVIFGIMLIIAPLRIWAWTKRTCGELSEIRHLLRTAVADSRKEAKAQTQLLSAINKHLENIESGMYGDGSQAG